MDPPFFLGDSSGTIFFADDAGHCTESLCLSEKISLMKFHDGRDLLLVLSEDLMFSHFLLNAEGKLILDTAVKIKIYDLSTFLIHHLYSGLKLNWAAGYWLAQKFQSKAFLLNLPW